MKKILKSLLVVALLLVQLVPMMTVRAEDVVDAGVAADNDGKITIQNTVKDTEYKIYKVLVLESYDDSREAYAYTVAEGWEDFFGENGDGAEYVTFEGDYVYWNTDKSDQDPTVADFAKLALAYAKTKPIAEVDSKTADGNNDVVFENLELGYYLVDSTLGALCNLTTTHAEVTINEKNGVPTLEKQVKEDSVLNPDDPWGESNTADIGQIVEYRTTITAQKGAENYVLYDTMDAGLTYTTGSVSITLDYVASDKTDKVLVKDTDYYVDEDSTNDDSVANYTFKVTFSEELEASLSDGDKLVVTYNATLNENAVVGGEGNENDTYLEYGDSNKTDHDTTTTYTFRFDVVKTDDDETNKNILTGATFRLYDAQTDGNEIKLVKVSDGVYRIDLDATEGALIETVNGQVEITGLDAGTYWLEEVDAPDGYNKLTARKEVKVSANNDAVVSDDNKTYVSGGVQVINKSGSLLPETGGIGTVLFITIGSIMVLGFGVLLVTKLRLAKEM